MQKLVDKFLSDIIILKKYLNNNENITNDILTSTVYNGELYCAVRDFGLVVETFKDEEDRNDLIELIEIYIKETNEEDLREIEKTIHEFYEPISGVIRCETFDGAEGEDAPL